MYIADSNPNAYNLAMVFRFSLLSLLLGCLAFSVNADPLPQAERVMLRSTESLPAVDHLVVHNSERRLRLLLGDTGVRSYKIALWLNPIGTKERAGDFRTTEGQYYLSRRTPRSAYILSIQL